MRLAFRMVSVLFGLSLPASCGEPTGGLEPPASTDAESAELGWCDIEPILEARCWRCHGEPQANGAPFPLTTYASVTAPTPTSSDPGLGRSDAIFAAVSRDYMPLMLPLKPPVEPLSCEQKQTLLAWLEAGAPLGEAGENCASVTPSQLRCN